MGWSFKPSRWRSGCVFLSTPDFTAILNKIGWNYTFCPVQVQRSDLRMGCLKSGSGQSRSWRGGGGGGGGGDNWPKAPSAPVFLTILGSWSDFPSLGIDCLLAFQILGDFPKDIVGRVIANKMLCIYTMRSAAKCYLCILVIGPLRWSTLSKCYVPGWLVPLPW